VQKLYGECQNSFRDATNTGNTLKSQSDTFQLKVNDLEKQLKDKVITLNYIVSVYIILLNIVYIYHSIACVPYIIINIPDLHFLKRNIFYWYASWLFDFSLELYVALLGVVGTVCRPARRQKSTYY